MTTTDVSISPLRQEVTERILGLDALANFVEAHPDLPQPVLGYPDISYTIFVDGAEAMARCARILKHQAPLGTIEKDYSTAYCKVARQFGGGVELVVMTNRANVCEQVQVGTRTVERPIVTGSETVVEPVMEWRCSPLLDEPTAADVDAHVEAIREAEAARDEAF